MRNTRIIRGDTFAARSAADPAQRKGGWILEATGIAPEYRSATMREELDKFSRKLLRDTRIERLPAASGVPGVRYRSLSGDVLEMDYYSPHETYRRQYRVNGAVQPLSADGLIDSPTVKQRRNDPMLKLIGGDKKTDLKTFGI